MDTAREVVSVVIPCYNQGRFLAEAIGSATAADHRVEVVVIDDGSTDDTPAVARGFPVHYVRQANRGLAAARNRGLEESSGSFVIFLDADDRLLPGAIDAGARSLAAHPECAMAYGRCVMMGRDGTTWPTPGIPTVRTGHHAALLHTNMIWMPATAIFRRRPLIRLQGFASGFDAATDYDLYLRLSRVEQIHDHGITVAAYRRHDESMSGNASRMLEETLAVMLRHRPAEDDQLFTTWQDGWANWQDFYGTQLVEEIRAHLRERAFEPAAAKAATLWRLAPRIFSRELRKKWRLLYAGRAMPAAEISSARRRAET
jgi:glycosyltransferase involved in cell wall biosynthesis